MQKTIVITGCAQRIGLHTAQYFLQQGYQVIGVVRQLKSELQDLMQQYPYQLHINFKDFLTETIDKNFWQQYTNHHIVGFIHCASTFEFDLIDTCQASSLRIQQKVNCDIFIDACTSFYQAHTQPTGAGFIALIDSKVKRLNKDFYSYTLSKLQLRSSIDFLAMSCAPILRVNAISPGLTLPSGEQTLEEFEQAQQGLPFGYGSTPQDLVEMMKFLIEQKSIVGQTIDVDAGQHLMSDRDILFKK